MTTNTNDITVQIDAAIAKVRRYEDALADAKAELRTLRGQVTKAKSAPRACGCGCGDLTSGGTFLPGHDAKMRSRLLKEIRDGESEESERTALATLRQYDKLAHGISEYDLGRDRKARAERDARKAQTEQERQDRQARDETERKQREALRTRSRAEQNLTAEQVIAQKKAAIADAKKNGMPANVAAK